jgi:glycosyltransferase involved in cell wall biosynthesis
MVPETPDFSLILATYGNRHFISRFLDSLIARQGASFEVIVVDQNDRPHFDLVRQYADRMDVRLIQASPGLSAARNVGIREARGRVIAFPDDDCWYPEGLLAAVRDRLADRRVDGLTCRCTDEHGRVSAGSADREAGSVTKQNVWRRGVSATLFVRSDVVKAVGNFDEALGLGAKTKFQSGEETDYLLRAIAGGMKLRYEPALSVYHPLPPPSRQAGAVKKSWQYGLGMGRVLAKHDYSHAQVYWFLAFPLLGAMKAVCVGDLALARVRATRTMARYRGWRWRPQQTIAPPPWQLR